MKIEFGEKNFIRFLEKLVQWGTRDTCFFSMSWEVFDPLRDPLILDMAKRTACAKASMYTFKIMLMRKSKLMGNQKYAKRRLKRLNLSKVFMK